MLRAEVGLQEAPERRRGTRYLVQLPVSCRPSAGSLRGPILNISATRAALTLLQMEQREARAPAGRGS